MQCRYRGPRRASKRLRQINPSDVSSESDDDDDDSDSTDGEAVDADAEAEAEAEADAEAEAEAEAEAGGSGADATADAVDPKVVAAGAARTLQEEGAGFAALRKAAQRQVAKQKKKKKKKKGVDSLCIFNNKKDLEKALKIILAHATVCRKLCVKGGAAPTDLYWPWLHTLYPDGFKKERLIDAFCALDPACGLAVLEQTFGKATKSDTVPADVSKIVIMMHYGLAFFKAFLDFYDNSKLCATASQEAAFLAAVFQKAVNKSGKALKFIVFDALYCKARPTHGTAPSAAEQLAHTDQVVTDLLKVSHLVVQSKVVADVVRNTDLWLQADASADLPGSVQAFATEGVEYRLTQYGTWLLLANHMTFAASMEERQELGLALGAVGGGSVPLASSDQQLKAAVRRAVERSSASIARLAKNPDVRPKLRSRLLKALLPGRASSAGEGEVAELRFIVDAYVAGAATLGSAEALVARDLRALCDGDTTTLLRRLAEGDFDDSLLGIGVSEAFKFIVDGRSTSTLPKKMQPAFKSLVARPTSSRRLTATAMNNIVRAIAGVLFRKHNGRKGVAKLKATPASPGSAYGDAHEAAGAKGGKKRGERKKMREKGRAPDAASERQATLTFQSGTATYSASGTYLQTKDDINTYKTTTEKDGAISFSLKYNGRAWTLVDSTNDVIGYQTNAESKGRFGGVWVIDMNHWTCVQN